MADATIALPYNATTSGDQLDASSLVVGAATVKRERMVIGNDTSSHVAVVTTSGALRVSAEITGQPVIITGSVTANLSSNPALTSGIVTLSSAIAISSGLITLSSPIGISSGLITLTGLNTVTLSSNPVAGQVVSLSSGTITLSSVIGISSGLVTLSSNPVASQIVSLSSGTVTLTNPSTAVTIIGSTGTASVVTSAGSNTVSIVSSGGIFAPVTSSGGLIVTLATGAGGSGAGSTAVNIVGGGSVYAPVTSSYGLSVNIGSSTVLVGQMTATVGAPVLQILTTAAAYVYALHIASTANAGNVVDFFSATSALSTDNPRIRTVNIIGGISLQFRGNYFSNGISMLCKLTAGTTGANTSGALVTVEYSV